ncbi:dephospho-CoA kinase [Gracilibacillus halotolerans]|uniref:Dephospho-CoA kinase n=1 Tax=Gracilibacillus halotolerans TaxID=74386 RepID=A0A841RSH6_9BACI|nr:dephospho-CoA kinase [Gracilibacillus halotolerans]MBB6513894.1 dephospho-CoA kinase [Gracilibacillus halotolerans]
MIIGLTGNIASGKTTIANILHETYHFPIIDADLIARKVVEPGEMALSQLVDIFGEEIVLDNGELNRAKLGKIVFQDDAKRQQLNNIVHPAIRKRMVEEKDKLLDEGYKHIVMDIPLLFENKLTYLVDKTLVVYTKEEIRLQRLMKRNGFTEEEARNRMNAQMDAEEKKKLADEWIDNSGSKSSSKEQLETILEKWSLK